MAYAINTNLRSAKNIWFMICKEDNTQKEKCKCKQLLPLSSSITPCFMRVAVAVTKKQTKKKS